MKTLWTSLEAWAVKNAGRSLKLRPGASEKSIAAAEKAMDQAFSKEYRASLLLHQGQEGDGDPEGLFEWMPGCAPLRSLEHMTEQWKELREFDEEGELEPDESDKRIHSVVFHPKRIPIAGNSFWDGDNTFLDFVPGPKGKAGQVVTFVSECDLAVMGDTFEHAVELYLNALESGDWRFDEKKGFVVPNNEKDDKYPNESEEFGTYVKKKSRKH